MQTAALIATQNALRQTLRVEKTHWAKLRHHFKVNSKLVKHIAGEPVLSIGCFVGLLSLINTSGLCMYEQVVTFINFERQNHLRISAILRQGGVNTLSENQLSQLIHHHIIREKLVEDFVNAILFYTGFSNA